MFFILENFLLIMILFPIEIQALKKSFGKLLIWNNKKIFQNWKLFCRFACVNFTFCLTLHRQFAKL